MDFLPVAGGTVTPNGTGEVTARATITDSAGNRDWPSFQRFHSNGSDAIGNRIASTITGTQIVERNGCWQESGSWHTTLWFIDSDRIDHTPILIDITCDLSGFDQEFLEQHEVVNSGATRPQLPLAVEDLSWSSTHSVEADVAPFSILSASDAPPGTLVTSQTTVLVARLSAGRTVSASIENGEMRVNDGLWSTESSAVSRGDQIEVRTTSSPTSGASVAATLTLGAQRADFTITAWNAVSSISDSFEGIPDGTELEDIEGYQIISGTAGALTVKNGAISTSSLSSWVKHTDDLSRVDGLRFKGRWGQGGGARFGLAHPDNPTSSHFMLYRRWDGSFRIDALGNTWVYPACGSSEVSVELAGSAWSVIFDGEPQAPSSGGQETLSSALDPTMRLAFTSPAGNGNRHDTLREFTVEHI